MQYADAFEYILQLLKDHDPEIGWALEPLSSMVVKPHAYLYQTLLDDANQFIDGILLQGDLSDSFVDKLAAVYGLTRKEGNPAQISIKLYLTNRTTTTIPAGTSFTLQDVEFITTQAYTGVLSSDLVTSDNIKLIKDDSIGPYFFIDAEATTLQAVSLNIGDELTTSASNVSQAIVDSFISGNDAETNEELLARIKQRFAAPQTGTPSQITSLILTQFSDIFAVKVIGFNDPELTRKQILGGAAEVDVYVKSSKTISSVTLTKNASLTSTYGDWEILIGPDDAPGFLDVQNLQFDDGSLITDYTVEYFGQSSNNSYEDSSDLRFSIYQEARIKFKHEAKASGLSVGDQQSTQIQLYVDPNLKSITENISDLLSAEMDVLIRAAIPCFVTLFIRIKGASNNINVAAIKSNIADEINSNAFNLPFELSNVIKRIYQSLPSNSVVMMPIVCYYRYWTPDGFVTRITNDRIDIMPISSNTSNNTVGLICFTSDINLEVVP